LVRLEGDEYATLPMEVLMKMLLEVQQAIEDGNEKKTRDGFYPTKYTKCRSHVTLVCDGRIIRKTLKVFFGYTFGFHGPLAGRVDRP